MSFADFLDVMHQHSKVENLPDEVVDAFKAADTQSKGTLPAKQLRHLLQNWGEGLSVREVIYFGFYFPNLQYVKRLWFMYSG